MSTETIKDVHYRIVGHIETRADGIQVAKNAHYRILGFFDPITKPRMPSIDWWGAGIFLSR